MKKNIFILCLILSFASVANEKNVKGNNSYIIHYIDDRKGSSILDVENVHLKIKTFEKLNKQLLCEGKERCYSFFDEDAEIKEQFNIFEKLPYKKYSVFNVNLESKNFIKNDIKIIDILQDYTDYFRNKLHKYEVIPIEKQIYFEKYFYYEDNSNSKIENYIAGIKNFKNMDECVLNLNNFIDSDLFLKNISKQKINELFFETSMFRYTFDFSCKKDKVLNKVKMEIKEGYVHSIAENI